MLYYIYHIWEKMPTAAPHRLFVHAHHVISIQKPAAINNLPPALEHQPCGHCCVCPLTCSKSQGKSSTITQIQCPCPKLYIDKSNMDNRAQKQHQQTKPLFVNHKTPDLFFIESTKPHIRGSIYCVNI